MTEFPKQPNQLTISQIPILADRAGRFPISYTDSLGRTRHYSSLPDSLYAWGNTDLLRAGSRRVAIIGARNTTEEAMTIAYQLGLFMSETGAITISGSARGIDQAAQSGAMRSGHAVGVLASNPNQNTPNHAQIVETSGLVLTENNTNNPFPSHFVQRNRLIAGLSDAVVLVAGGENSGSAHTLRVAWALDIPIGIVVPHDITSDHFALNRQLLAQREQFPDKQIFEIPVPTGEYQENKQLWIAVFHDN